MKKLLIIFSFVFIAACAANAKEQVSVPGVEKNSKEAAEFLKAVRGKAIVPLNRGRSGYVNGVKIIGTKGTLTLTKEHEIKKYLALGLLRSTYFMVQPNYEKGKVKSFIFYGGGWGHGVGLCQTGSGGRAEAGQDYEQILKHYYTGTELKDIRQK